MITLLTPAAEFRLARLSRAALRHIIAGEKGTDIRRQIASLAIARIVAIGMPLLARDDDGVITVSVLTKGAFIQGTQIGDWELHLRTLPGFMRRLNRAVNWKDARDADKYLDLFRRYADTQQQGELDAVSQHLSLFLARAALQHGRREGEVVVRDAEGPLVVVRIRRASAFASARRWLGNLYSRLGFGDRILLQNVWNRHG